MNYYEKYISKIKEVLGLKLETKMTDEALLRIINEIAEEAQVEYAHDLA